MPKIFVLRHQLAEQQARLKQQAKGETTVHNSVESTFATPQNLSTFSSLLAPPPPPIQQIPLDLGRLKPSGRILFLISPKKVFRSLARVRDLRLRLIWDYFDFIFFSSSLEYDHDSPSVILLLRSREREESAKTFSGSNVVPCGTPQWR